uniref:Uncharacterized protein n=1 Tax=Vibrio splendidus TaxID=29497 RepID=A0A0H3ZR68_VIBSP|nr:hypothetical protein [Vibrio splendidus]
MVITLEANHLKHVFGQKRVKLKTLIHLTDIRKSILKP